jgi:hypothetical protein
MQTYFYALWAKYYKEYWKLASNNLWLNTHGNQVLSFKPWHL